MSAITVNGAFARMAAEKPDKAIVSFADESVTRRELENRSNRLARAYREMGVRPGDYVTIALKNSIGFMEAMVAAWKLGATPQPVSYRLPLRELQAIAEVVQPRIVVGGDPMIDGFSTHVPADFSPAANLSEKPLPEAEPGYFKAPTSGGSTGRPKIIVSQAKAEVNYADPLADLLKIEREDTFLVAGPLYHNLYFTFSAYTMLWGGHVVLMEKFEPEQTLALVERHRVSYLILVPTMMHRIWRLGKAVREAYDLSSIRIMLHAASMCPKELKSKWIDWLGADRVWELYGGTEAQGLTFFDGKEWLSKPGTVGKMLAGFQAKVCDEQGRELPRGEVGEIYMRPDAGPGTTYFYLGAEPKQIAGGWETIGDMGYMDEDGYLFLADRRTDMIVSGGANIYPAEVEGALEQHPAVRSAVVIGLPDEDLGHVAHAIVDAVNPVTAEELIGHMKNQVVTYKIPRSFEFVTGPLRDDAGKVRRTALRDERLARR